MAAPLTDFVDVFRRIFRFLRWASYALIGVTAVVLILQCADLSDRLAALHPWLGGGVVAAVIAAFVFLIGVPVMRFLRVPAALTPPKEPEDPEQLTPRHAVGRAEFLERYVAGMRRNPMLEGARGEIDRVLKACGELKARVARANVKDGMEEIESFRAAHVDALLAPIDAEVDKIIRREALGVGLATAISPNGTLDAFIVLWRNANMVSRVARLYYGRPGARGSLTILRDVSAATLLATYLEGVTEAAGSLLGSLLGSFAGVVAGPVLEGGVNAVATLRIGAVARARCRSLRPWNARTRTDAVKAAIASTKDKAREVLGSIAAQAGGSIVEMPGKAFRAAKGGLGAVWRRITGEEGGEPEGATQGT